jgi:C1A family cysteine protease
MKTALSFALAALLLLVCACAAQPTVTPTPSPAPIPLSPTPTPTFSIFDFIRRNNATAAAQMASALPRRWDWRERGVVTAVKDQGDCNACYAFAAIANIESRILMDGGGAFDFSEDQAKGCNWEWHNGYASDENEPRGGCEGGSYRMLANLFSTGGTVLEACDPYQADVSICNATCPYQKTLLGWDRVSHEVVPDADELKRAILEHGPVAASMYVGEDPRWRLERSRYDGSYTIYSPLDKGVDHSVLIVGWDDDLPYGFGKGAWIVKESYGSDWGGTAGYGDERGYATIAYGSAGIGKEYSYITEWQDYDPNEELLYCDDAGWNADLGFGSTAIQVLAMYWPYGDSWARRVEFWTTDRTVDVDVYIYDEFDGKQPSGLLFKQEDLSYQHAGYHSIAIQPPLRLNANDGVAVVVSLTNSSNGYPIAADRRGLVEQRRNYASASGEPGTWRDLAEDGTNAGVRLRTSRLP